MRPRGAGAAEALDLERPEQLLVEAVPDASRREHDEREEDRRGATRARRPANAHAAAAPRPSVDTRAAASTTGQSFAAIATPSSTAADRETTSARRRRARAWRAPSARGRSARKPRGRAGRRGGDERRAVSAERARWQRRRRASTSSQQSSHLAVEPAVVRVRDRLRGRATAARTRAARRAVLELEVAIRDVAGASHRRTLVQPGVGDLVARDRCVWCASDQDTRRAPSATATQRRRRRARRHSTSNSSRDHRARRRSAAAPRRDRAARRRARSGRTARAPCRDPGLPSGELRQLLAQLVERRLRVVEVPDEDARDHPLRARG